MQYDVIIILKINKTDLDFRNQNKNKPVQLNNV